MQPFIIVVRVTSSDEIQRFVTIAAHYKLEYTLAVQQIYLFIPNKELLVDIARTIKDTT